MDGKGTKRDRNGKEDEELASGQAWHDSSHCYVDSSFHSSSGWHHWWIIEFICLFHGQPM